MTSEKCFSDRSCVAQNAELNYFPGSIAFSFVNPTQSLFRQLYCKSVKGPEAHFLLLCIMGFLHSHLRPFSLTSLSICRESGNLLKLTLRSSKIPLQHAISSKSLDCSFPAYHETRKMVGERWCRVNLRELGKIATYTTSPHK